jgi:glycosyltransferase involved in cell wall biosynthesis
VSDRRSQLPKVVFLARTLERTGGAERQLAYLAAGLHDRGWPVKVLTFYDHVGLGEDLVRRGVRLGSLNKHGRWDVVPFMRRLARELRDEQAAILQTMLTPPNVLAALMPRGTNAPRLAWGLRASDMDYAKYDWTHALLGRAEAALSRRADLIIANSEAGRAAAIARGFSSKRLAVIPNGIDTERFHPTAEAELRAQWLRGGTGPLIGIVARLDPMKDHLTFLQAAAQFVRQAPAARFVCVGSANTVTAAAIRNCCSELRLDGHVIWESERLDVERAINAFDLLTLSSAFGEGFPNVVGEALACGVPVVVTDVGDARAVVGDCGEVVPRRDPQALAAAWGRILALDAGAREQLRAAARQRIVAHFSLATMVDRTAQQYLALAAAPPH